MSEVSFHREDPIVGGKRYVRCECCGSEAVPAEPDKIHHDDGCKFGANRIRFQCNRCGTQVNREKRERADGSMRPDVSGEICTRCLLGIAPEGEK